jgi:hypothetical protein
MLTAGRAGGAAAASPAASPANAAASTHHNVSDGAAHPPLTWQNSQPQQPDDDQKSSHSTVAPLDGSSAASRASSNNNRTAHATSALKHFRDSSSVRQQYDSVYTSLIDRIREAAHARHGLSRFKEKCCRNGAFHSLPSVLAIRTSTQLRLTPVAGQPAFYADALTKLKAAEHKAEQEMYDIVIAAKELHVKHTAASSNAARFITDTVAAFAATTATYAASFTQLWSDGTDLSQSLTASFPVDTAVHAFRSHTNDVVHRALASRIIQEIEDREKAAAAKADDGIAQSTVLEGAHNGQTIGLIAQKAAREEVQRLQRNAQQANTDARVRSQPPPVRAPAPVSSNPRHQQQQPSKPTQPQAEPRASTTRAKPAIPRAVTPAKRRFEQSGEDPLAPATTRPKNEKGRDRSRSATPAPNLHECSPHKRHKQHHQQNNSRRQPAAANNSSESTAAAKPFNRRQ